MMDSIEDGLGFYEPTEDAFIPSLRWLLEELKEPISFSNLPTHSFVIQLCDGERYQKLANKLFKPSTPSDSSKDFLMLLMENGCWSGGDSSLALHSAIKDMLTDCEPFYESIHLNVIEALMVASVRDVTVETISAEIQTFPDYNPTRDKPFDLEDALMIWMNRSTGMEMDDLLAGCHDGKVLIALLSKLQLMTGAECDCQTSRQRIEYFCSVYRRVCGYECSWKAEELTADGNINISKRLGIKKVFIQSICRLFQYHLARKNGDDEVFEEKVTQEEVQQEEMDDDAFLDDYLESDDCDDEHVEQQQETVITKKAVDDAEEDIHAIQEEHNSIAASSEVTIQSNNDEDDYAYEAISIIDQYLEFEQQNTEELPKLKEEEEEFSSVKESEQCEEVPRVKEEEEIEDTRNNTVEGEESSPVDYCTESCNNSKCYTISFSMGSMYSVKQEIQQEEPPQDEEEEDKTEVSNNSNKPTPKALWEKKRLRMVEKLEERRANSRSPVKQPPPQTDMIRTKSIQSLSNNNHQIIRNALTKILGGRADLKMQEQVLKALDEHLASEQGTEQYVILLKNPQHQSYRGLYVLSGGVGEVDEQRLIRKLHGNAPDFIDHSKIGALYKYDSGSRMFRILSSKTIGPTTHAFCCA